MPARPAYYHRLGDALASLRRLSTDWVDRRTVEEVLGVSKTVAWRLLRRFGGSEGPGNTLVCRRETLISALEALEEDSHFRQEMKRRERLEGQLGRLLAAARSQHIDVAPRDVAIGIVSSRFAHLPAGVELTPSRLTIEFHGAADFLQKVGAVVFALQNDYEAIRDFLDAPGSDR